ncbi:MAG TPA: LptF/LptG family permease [Nevskiaceae bacterium]|nr:LptF/LptG family permease [Nevskiaceae bacterium]
MTTLPRYLRRRVLGAGFGAWAVLTALMQTLDLLNATGDILKRGLGLAGVMHYALLSLPSELLMALPLAVLIGTLLAFYGLARTREGLAIRASGISLRRTVLWLLPVAALFAVLQFGLADRIVPPSQTALAQWWNATRPPDTTPAETGPRWVRTHNALISIGGISDDARHLTHITTYRRDAVGLLTARWTANAAQWKNHGWELTSRTALDLQADHLQHRKEPSATWHDADFAPRDLLRLDVSQPHLSTATLLGVIAGRDVSALPLSYYQMALWSLFVDPLAAFVFLLLTIPACRTSLRAEGAGTVLVWALALGLAYVLCNGLLASMGSAGRLQPAFAALLPLALFLGVGTIQLIRADRL